MAVLYKKGFKAEQHLRLTGAAVGEWFGVVA